MTGGVDALPCDLAPRQWGSNYRCCRRSAQSDSFAERAEEIRWGGTGGGYLLTSSQQGRFWTHLDASGEEPGPQVPPGQVMSSQLSALQVHTLAGGFAVRFSWGALSDLSTGVRCCTRASCPQEVRASPTQKTAKRSLPLPRSALKARCLAGMAEAVLQALRWLRHNRAEQVCRPGLADLPIPAAGGNCLTTHCDCSIRF